MTQDESHLKLLSIFHYVLAAMSAFFSSFFLIHFGLGAAMLGGAFAHDKSPPPPAVGILFMGIGGIAILVGWSFAACLIVAGRSLSRHKRHTFCVVVAALCCVLCNPLGTVLGVFTLVVLLRPSVKALFEAGMPSSREAS
jgi:hypothetical protein